MIDLKFLDDFSRKLAETLPPAMGEMRADVEKNARGVLEAMLRKLDLVTREEFEVQTMVLERTREKFKLLESRIKVLEEQARTPSN